MRYCLIILLILTVTVLTGNGDALAWGQNGHRITVEIGERNVNAKTKAVIASFLGDESLAEIATWPDDIRSDSSWNFSHPWHFFSINDDETWENVAHDPDGDVLSAMEKLEAFLSDPDSKTMLISGDVVFGKGENAKTVFQQKTIDKRQALAFYVHFVGDVHQPLHVGRREDLGGNKIAVLWFDDETSLHKVWDELLIESNALSFTETASFLNRVSAAQRQEWAASDNLDWAKESKAVRDQVYDFGKQKPPYYLNVTTAPVLKWGYRHDALPIINDRLAKGGIRLAARLDELFSSY